MNTHILIPIEIAKKFRVTLRERARQYQVKGNLDKEAEFLDKTIGFDQAVSLGKQISLDEKDIEKRAAISVTDRYDLKDTFNQAGAGGYNSGYKQALKDLL